jgi:arylsulfatase A-like enzyme
VPDDFPVRYNPAKIPLPPNFLPEHPFDNGELDIRDEQLLPRPRLPAQVREFIAGYYRSISFLDAQVGRILDALKASGQAERTIIVFSSDQGVARGSHGLIGKQNLYEHSMGAPLIFAGPGIPKGRRTPALCYLLDIFPTLGDLCGVPAPDGNEGVSLKPVLAGKRNRARDSVFLAYRNVQRAVRDDRWKLIVYPQVNRTQLFDLRADAAENHDVASTRGRWQEVQRLAALLKNWQQRLGDPLALP